MFLHNRVNREELINRLHREKFKRTTLSFYRYFLIDDPQGFRDHMYARWFRLNVFGRIYVAREGINAQLSLPEKYLERFVVDLNSTAELENMPLKFAIEDDGKSFFKLTIKVRPKIVADGLDEGDYDVTNVGSHLSPLEFHEQMDKEGTIVIDMRNHYESEVGRFVNAYCPDVDTFKDAIKSVEKAFEDRKDNKLLLYCTGGIRCEKASAYLKSKGFQDVNQLYGGIISYANEIRPLGLESRFTGKNFVFDERLGESVDGKVIAHCHQCGEPCDTHTNCANDDCHLLFIQCGECRQKYDVCCSADCKHIISLPAAEREKYKVLRKDKYADSKIYKRGLRPKLNGRIGERTC